MEKYEKIKIKSEDEIKGFNILLVNGIAVCLPKNEYLVPIDVLDVLKKEGISFKVIKV